MWNEQLGVMVSCLMEDGCEESLVWLLQTLDAISVSREGLVVVILLHRNEFHLNQLEETAQQTPTLLSTSDIPLNDSNPYLTCLLELTHFIGTVARLKFDVL